MFASQEAVALATPRAGRRGLDAVKLAPESSGRSRVELAQLIPQGNSLIAMAGYAAPEVSQGTVAGGAITKMAWNTRKPR